MYTVARFMSAASDLATLERIGKEIDAVRPGSFEGMRKYGTGVSISVSTATTWTENWQAIEEFLESFAPQVAATLNMGGAVVLDVAVESEDHEHGPRSVIVGADIIKVLATHGVHFEVTVY